MLHIVKTAFYVEIHVIFMVGLEDVLEDITCMAAWRYEISLRVSRREISTDVFYQQRLIVLK